MEKILKIIEEKDNWLVAGHINPDGDAVSSLLLMSQILLHFNKKFELFLKDGIPRRYKGLIKDEVVNTELPEGYSNLLVLDTSVFERTGIEKWDGFIVNIDHHGSNTYFGDVNWVEPYAVAACAMIYRLLKFAKIPLNKRIAELVYAGIYVETGGFSYSNTDTEAFKIAHEIAEIIDIPKIVYSISRKTEEELRMMAKVLHTLEFKDGIAIIEMRKNMAESIEIYRSIEADDFIKFPLFLNGVKVAVFLREDVRRGGIRVSFRSREYDVDKIAKELGGGGHRTASGVHIDGMDIKEIREIVRKTILRHIVSERSTVNK